MIGKRAPSPEYARARKGFAEYIEVIRRESLSVAQAGVEPSEQSEFLAGLRAITLSSKMMLAFSDLLAEQIDDAARTRLATVLEHSIRVVAAASTLSRHFDVPTKTHTALAVKMDGTRRGKLGGAGKTKLNAENAERVRDIIEAAPRKPGEPRLFKHPGAVLDAVRDRLGAPDLDRNTLKGYRELVDASVKIDGPHG